MFSFILKLFAIWPVCFCIFLILGIWNNYTPQEITELQEVPLILQGDTDMGGSILFADYVSAHLVLGFLASLHLTVLLDRSPARSSIALLFKDKVLFAGYFVAFVTINAFLFWLLLSEAVNYNKHFHFFCEYVQVFILIIMTYGLTILWISLLSWKIINFLVKLACAPFILIFLVLLCFNGITPKAGQIVQAGEIPSYLPRSLSHAILLELHKSCLSCIDAIKKRKEK